MSAPSEPQNHGITATATEESAVSHRVEVRVEAARVKKAFDRAYRDLAKEARVKGFRKGKTPRSVLERLYGAAIGEEIERQLVSETLADAVELTGLEPVATPAIDAEPPKSGTDFTYVARLEVKPKIALGEIEGLPARKPPVEVTDEQVAEQLEALRQRNAAAVEEPEGTRVETGHVLSVDFVGRIDGQVFEGSSGRDVELEVGAGRFIEGFETQLVGAAAGEDREVRVRFPDDYANAELAGREAVFDVHVAAVKRRHVPDLDDEFAKDLGDFDTLDALRERVRSDMLEGREREARQQLRHTLMDALIERTPFEVPGGLVDQQLEQQLRAAVQRLHGAVPEEALRAQVERWREEWRAPAEREVRESLLLEAVAADREIAADDAEIDARLERLAGEQGVPADRLREALGDETARATAERQLRAEKALDFLVAAAKVEETTDT